MQRRSANAGAGEWAEAVERAILWHGGVVKCAALYAHGAGALPMAGAGGVTGAQGLAMAAVVMAEKGSFLNKNRYRKK